MSARRIVCQECGEEYRVAASSLEGKSAIRCRECGERIAIRPKRSSSADRPRRAASGSRKGGSRSSRSSDGGSSSLLLLGIGGGIGGTLLLGVVAWLVVTNMSGDDADSANDGSNVAAVDDPGATDATGVPGDADNAAASGDGAGQLANAEIQQGTRLVTPAATGAQPVDEGPAPLTYKWTEGEEVAYRYALTATLPDSTLKTYGEIVYTSQGTAEPAFEIAVRGSGTGFVVSPVGHLVTCAHVVDGAKSIEAVLEGRTHEATVVAIDQAHDLAIVKIDTETPRPLPMGTSESVKLAQEVRAFGYPLSDVLGESLKITSGSVSGIVPSDEGNLFQVDASINPGNSGGPILDRRGVVVGVASAKLTGEDVSNVGFAVPVDEAVRLLTKHGVPHTVPESLEPREPTELAKAVEPRVALLRVTSGSAPVGESLQYTARMTESRRRKPGTRFSPIGLRPPISKSENGSLAVEDTGEVVGRTGQIKIPLLERPLAELVFDPLPDSGAATWSRSRSVILNLTSNGRRTPTPAVLNKRYELRGESDGVATIQSRLTIDSLDRVAGESRFSIDGEGTKLFDTGAGKPISFEFKGKATQRSGSLSASVAFEFEFEQVDIEELRAEREKALADAKRREEERKAAQPKLVDADDPDATGLIARVEKPGYADTLAFSPDSTRLVWGHSGGLGFYDLAKNQALVDVIDIPDLDNVKSGAFSASGSSYACGVNKGAVFVFGMADGGPPRDPERYDGHSRAVECVALSDDGKLALSADQDKRVHLWETSTRANKAIIAFDKRILAMCFLGDEEALVADGAEVHLVNLRDGSKRIRCTTKAIGAQKAVFSPDHSRVAIAAGLNVQLFDTETGAESPKLDYKHHGYLKNIGWSPDAKRLYTDGQAKLVVWDPGSGQPLETFQTGLSKADTFAVSPDGRYVALHDGWGINPILLYRVSGKAD